MRQETKDLILAVLDGKRVQHRATIQPEAHRGAWITFSDPALAVRFLSMEYPFHECRLEPKPDVVRYHPTYHTWGFGDLAAAKRGSRIGTEFVRCTYDGETNALKSTEIVKE